MGIRLVSVQAGAGRGGGGAAAERPCCCILFFSLAALVFLSGHHPDAAVPVPRIARPGGDVMTKAVCRGGDATPFPCSLRKTTQEGDSHQLRAPTNAPQAYREGRCRFEALLPSSLSFAPPSSHTGVGTPSGPQRGTATKGTRAREKTDARLSRQFAVPVSKPDPRAHPPPLEECLRGAPREARRGPPPAPCACVSRWSPTRSRLLLRHPHISGYHPSRPPSPLPPPPLPLWSPSLCPESPPSVSPPLCTRISLCGAVVVAAVPPAPPHRSPSWRLGCPPPRPS